jgi:hypothetical protein
LREIGVRGAWDGVSGKGCVDASALAQAAAQNKKPSLLNWAFCFNLLGWPMGLEPTTTGITILSIVQYKSIGYVDSLEHGISGKPGEIVLILAIFQKNRGYFVAFAVFVLRRS